MADSLQRLTPEEEVAYLRNTLGVKEPAQLLDRILSNFSVLQARSAMLLSLITICLTISGFSGHRIAAAGWIPSVFLALGLLFAVGSACILLSGPLQLRWLTRHACPSGLEATLIEMIRIRDRRTRRYHVAAGCLVLGLCFYMASVVMMILLKGATV